MSLYTRENIYSNDWVKVTIDDEFLKRAEELEKIENNPDLTNIQCLSGHQVYPFLMKLQVMKTKDITKKTLKKIL